MTPEPSSTTVVTELTAHELPIAWLFVVFAVAVGLLFVYRRRYPGLTPILIGVIGVLGVFAWFGL